MRFWKDDLPTLRWIYRTIGKGRKWGYFLTLLWILQGAVAAVAVLQLREVIAAAVDGNAEAFAAALCIYGLFILAGIGLRTAGGYMEEKGKAVLEKNFRREFIRELMTRSYAEVSAVHSGEWMNRICSDSRIITESVLQVFPRLVGMAAQAVCAACVLAVLFPLGVCLVVPGAVVLAALSFLFRKKLKYLHRRVQEKDGTVRSYLQEQISGLTVIHAFGQEKNIEKSTDAYLERWVEARLQRNHWLVAHQFIMSGVMQGGYLLGLILCGAQLIKGSMDYGALVAVLQLFRQTVGPVNGLTGFAPQYYAMLASGERMMEILEYPPDQTQEGLNREEITRFYAERFFAIRFVQAGFSYDRDQREPVLSDFHMELKKGEYLALMGRSGSGKSTILKLMLSFYDLQEGRRMLLDTEGREYELTSAWRGLFAYVPQGNYLLSGTIRETVTFGDPDAARLEEKIAQALYIACAEEFVRELPEGIDTNLGELGRGLSEGQLQRLTIARAIFSERPVLILDEATASCIYTQKGNKKIRKPQAANQTALIFDRRAAARLLSINSIRRLCWS